MNIFIDVGCHVGYYSFIWTKDPRNFVYAFEPIPHLYEDLKIHESRLKNFKVFPYAISEVDGFSDFYINENLATCSLKEFVDKRFITKEKITVPTKRLDTFCTEMSLQHIHTLKTDAQGSDLDVLKSMGDKLGICAHLLIEAFITDEDTYVDEVKRNDVIEYVTKRGFDFVSESIDGNYTDLRFQKK